MTILTHLGLCSDAILVAQRSEYEAASESSFMHLPCAGLVYNLTEYLSSLGINIESLETYTQEVRILTSRFPQLINSFFVFSFGLANY